MIKVKSAFEFDQLANKVTLQPLEKGGEGRVEEGELPPPTPLFWESLFAD